MFKKFDRTTISRLSALVIPFFRSDVKWKALGLLFILISLILTQQGVINVLLSYLNRDVMTAFSLREGDEFYRKLIIYLLTFACATPVAVLKTYVEQRLALVWRRWLSRNMLERYFSNFVYYKIGSYEGIDNPDQRLEEDIRSITTSTLSLFVIICDALLQLVFFLWILWSISTNLVFWAITYAIGGSVITSLIGRRLPRLNFQQLKMEADYRYKLVNVRDNTESIAFYRGGKKENTRSRQRLKIALGNALRIINLNRNLAFFKQGYDYLKPVVPIIIVAPLYLSGKVEFGVVTQSADAFLRVVDSLSIVVVHFGTISAISAFTTRLGSFSEAIEQLQQQSTAEDTGDRIQVLDGSRIAFDSVRIQTPKRDQTLLESVSFEVPSRGLLITGESGSGKSSILRVIAGLWTSGAGTVTRPSLEQCLFLPQRPYMILGSLRNQLLYALKRHGVSDKELEEVMIQVGLEDTLRRARSFDRAMDWPNLLSTGEQQRLAFARLVLARPRYAFLDEATTALDSAAEARLYRYLNRITENYVSIGYRATLSAYHGSVLELHGRGKWTLTEEQ